MQMVGWYEPISLEAVNTAWESNMELIVAFVLGAVCHWAWGKWGAGKL